MSEGARVSPLLETVRKTMEVDEWPVHQLPGRHILSSTVSTDSCEWSVFAATFEEDKQVAVYSVIPFTVPEDRRLAAAEVITRANYGLRLGNFEMDFADGELRFKTSIDVEGGTLAEAQVRSLLYANVSVTEKYLPSISAVVQSHVTPADAIAQIEG
jgi:hypothetical protein